MGQNEILNESLYDVGIFKAIFMAGAPGAGKDFMLYKIIAGSGLSEINSDVAFEMLLKKHQISMIMRSDNADRDVARGRAKKITQERERLFFTHRKGVVINGTGDDVEKYAKLKRELEDMGYETAMLFVNTSNDVSRQRNIDRGSRGGREVPENIRTEKWNDSQKNIGHYQHMFGDNFAVVDNSVDVKEMSKQEKEQHDARINTLFKKFKKFVAAPVTKMVAKRWIEKEKQKRKITQWDGVPYSTGFGNERKRTNLATEETIADIQETINSLKINYENIDKIELEHYSAIISVLNECSQSQLQQLADAEIKHVSNLARNRIKE